MSNAPEREDLSDTEIWDEITEHIFRRPTQSVTKSTRSRTIAPTNCSVAEKLKQEISPETYQIVVQRSREKAESEYQELIHRECEILAENRSIVHETVGTGGDAPGGPWRNDPTQLTDRELRRETEKLKCKLKVINQENAALKG
jgi:hypothetical protein